MVTIKLSDKQCFLCGTSSYVVDARFKDGTFSGSICKEHLFERMEAKYGKPADEKKTAFEIPFMKVEFYHDSRQRGSQEARNLAKQALSACFKAKDRALQGRREDCFRGVGLGCLPDKLPRGGRRDFFPPTLWRTL